MGRLANTGRPMMGRAHDGDDCLPPDACLGSAPASELGRRSERKRGARRITAESAHLLSAIALAFGVFIACGATAAKSADGARGPDNAAGEVMARGRIEPQGSVVTVGAPPESLSTVAIVDKLLVEQGSKVKAGQLLAVIYGYDLSRADYQVAQANLAVARLEREQLQAGTGKPSEVAAQKNVLAARLALLAKVEKDWDRTTMLVRKNASAVQLLDSDKAALDQATQEVEQERNIIKSLTEVRPVDDALAAGKIAVAEANVAKARAAMERLEVRARQAGTVLSIETRSGESVAGDGILRLGDLDHLVVIAEVDETQIGAIKLGMAATIEGSVLPQSIAGTVTRISKEVFRQKRPSSDILLGRDARIVEVEVSTKTPLPEVVGAEVLVRFEASTASR